MHLVESVGISMDLNTITEVARPRTREQLPVWTAGDAWLAGGTWLFSEPQTHLTRLLDLSHLHGRPARRVALPAGLDRLAADQPVLPRVSGLVQDLEDRNRGRQHLHVVAGRTDNRADHGARWRLHHLAGRWRRAEDRRRRLRHRRSAQCARARRSLASDRSSDRGLAAAFG